MLAIDHCVGYSRDLTASTSTVNSCAPPTAHFSLPVHTLDLRPLHVFWEGGTKVTRCEVTLDDGVSWRLADIKRFEKPNAAGKYWCWVHYELSVPVGAFGSKLFCKAKCTDLISILTIMITNQIVWYNWFGMISNLYHGAMSHFRIYHETIIAARN